MRRALTNLHRAANNEERERERAKREVDRLNGIVTSRSGGQNAGGSAATGSAGGSSTATSGNPNKEERTRQAEQLAALGVALPQEFRGELAMPGEWSVTSTTIVQDKPKATDEDDQNVAKARGVHKRDRTEEQLEHEEAVKGLFKKPRRWGRDARGLAEGSEDLDALLSGGLVVKKEDEEGEKLKEEDIEGAIKDEAEAHDVKAEEGLHLVKKEPEAEAEVESIPVDAPADEGKEATLSRVDGPIVKTEDDDRPSEAADLPVVAFKKRKAKNIRQK